MYNILEAHFEYRGKQLHKVTVLVEISPGDIRAIFADDRPKQGYEYLKPGEAVSEDLLQRVAGYGMQTDGRDNIFSGWKFRYRKTRNLDPG